jgi:2-polyprenyl-3-methyl-5-hydroxy-6-metoxy-1,4-benzoquinol methylase
MRSWYHTIDMPDGTATPGFYDTRESPNFVPWPKELIGGRCLDVGTFDGFWAFQLEKRGAAEVVALDLADPEALDWPYDHRSKGPMQVREWGAERRTGFNETAQALGSKAEWIDQSVYDLDPDRNGTFDVVFCGALLLHLRDPIRALEAMRSVCSGSLVLAEAIEPKLELLARWVPSAMLQQSVDQWWRPNTAGLRAMTHRAGFTVQEMGPSYVVPFGKAQSIPGRHPRLGSLLARGRGGSGVLHRALRATPRPPLDAGS